MDLFNRKCDPPEEAHRLAEAARGDSVTDAKLGCREVPGLLGTRLFGRRFLADRPLVGYLQPDEQPHHVFALGGVEPDDGEYVGATGGYSVMVAITDLRVLLVVGHRDAADESLTVPYDTVAGVKSAPANLWLRTDDEKYRLDVENSPEAEAARDYVLEQADAMAEGYLAEAETHDLSKTAEGDSLSSRADTDFDE
jgi:hypothetical protein